MLFIHSDRECYICPFAATNFHMRSIHLIFSWLLLATSTAFAQKPYFQQEVNYQISVALDDRNHLLRGSCAFEYINRSPDTLRFMYIHLWPNAYSSTKTAWARQLADMGNLDFLEAADSTYGRIDSLAFVLPASNTPLRMEQDEHNPDIAKLWLATPLAPGAKTTISTPFRVKIPADFSRMGHVGQGYQITQWYPKPAVYDNTGWHAMPYLDQGEFYSEFGSFDVHITVPKNYRVAATGVLQNEDEQRWLDSLAARGNAKQWTLNDSFPASDLQTKTLHYVQDKIHDFGWFADKRYNVMQSEVTLPNSTIKVKTWTFFLNKHKDRWQKAVAYVDSAVYYYSLWSGNYPYSSATAVEGALKAGGGMEYPMITVISDNGSDFSLDNVITHEVGHNWFYGILGTNERDFVWMDESVNTFFQDRIMMKKYPKATLGDGLGIPNGMLSLIDARDVPYSRMNELAGTLVERSNQQQPLETPSADFTPMNYGALAYLKGAYLFRYLMFYLGEARFDAAMHAYFDQCAFTHPGPADMKRIFEQSTGEDLSWFFYDLLQTRKISDYALTAARAENGEWQLQVANRGDLVIPFSISALKGGQVVQTVWYKGFAKAEMVDFPAADCDEFVLDYLRVAPEYNRDNNHVRTHGILRSVEALQLQFGTSLENERKNRLYLLPAVGWNGRDGLMAGALFHNLGIPARKFNFYAMPMYAFGAKTLTGAAGLKYDIQPTKGVQRIRLEVNTAQFSGWKKVSPKLAVTLMPKDLRTSFVHTFSINTNFLTTSFSGSGIQYTYKGSIYSAEWFAYKKGKLKNQSLLAKVLVGKYTWDTQPGVWQPATFEFEHRWSRRFPQSGLRLNSRFDLVVSEAYRDLLGADPVMGQYNIDRSENMFMPFSVSYDSTGAANLSSLGYRQRFASLGGTYSNPYFLYRRTVNGTSKVVGFGSYFSNISGFALLQCELVYKKLPVRWWAEVVPAYHKTNGVIAGAGTGLTFAFGDVFQIHAPLAGMGYEYGVPKNFRQFADALTFTLNLKPFNRPFDLPTAFF